MRPTSGAEAHVLTCWRTAGLRMRCLLKQHVHTMAEAPHAAANRSATSLSPPHACSAVMTSRRGARRSEVAAASQAAASPTTKRALGSAAAAARSRAVAIALGLLSTPRTCRRGRKSRLGAEGRAGSQGAAGWACSEPAAREAARDHEREVRAAAAEVQQRARAARRASTASSWPEGWQRRPAGACVRPTAGGSAEGRPAAWRRTREVGAGPPCRRAGGRSIQRSCGTFFSRM